MNVMIAYSAQAKQCQTRKIHTIKNEHAPDCSGGDIAPRSNDCCASRRKSRCTEGRRAMPNSGTAGKESAWVCFRQ